MENPNKIQTPQELAETPEQNLNESPGTPASTGGSFENPEDQEIKEEIRDSAIECSELLDKMRADCIRAQMGSPDSSSDAWLDIARRNEYAIGDLMERMSDLADRMSDRQIANLMPGMYEIRDRIFNGTSKIEEDTTYEVSLRDKAESIDKVSSLIRAVRNASM